MDEKILEEIRQVSKEYPDGIHRRSEAREMFEKLGYFQASLPDSEELVYNFKSSDIEDYRYIAFNKIDKYIEVDDWTKYFKLSLEELQAINKQVEELGWLNEQ